MFLTKIKLCAFNPGVGLVRKSGGQELRLVSLYI